MKKNEKKGWSKSVGTLITVEDEWDEIACGEIIRNRKSAFGVKFDSESNCGVLAYVRRLWHLLAWTCLWYSIVLIEGN